MEMDKFVRKPFTVKAVEITEDNIAEIAKKVGELRYKEDDTPYIHVNYKKVPNVPRVFPGFWLTEMGGNLRCYSPRAFEEQFVPSDDNIQEWVKYMQGKTNTQVEAPAS